LSSVAGVRDLRELRARPDKLRDAVVDLESVGRICKRVEQIYDAKVDASLLLAELNGQFVSHRTRITTGELPSAWLCDVCHRLIDNVDRGYVIWKSPRDGKNHGYKIIHKSECDLDDHDSSMALRDVLGQEGLNRLLSFLSSGSVLRRLEKGPRSSVPDVDEWVDFVRRVQIPNYDLARPLFGNSQFVADSIDSGTWMTYRPERLREAINNPRYKGE